MARLIDVEEVINIAKNTYTEEDVLKIAWLLCHTPTAYDVDKVVEILQECSSEHKNSSCEYEQGKSFAYKNAIDIVRKGGVG